MHIDLDVYNMCIYASVLSRFEVHIAYLGRPKKLPISSKSICEADLKLIEGKFKVGIRHV